MSNLRAWAVPPEIKQAVRDYAQQNGLSESAAVITLLAIALEIDNVELPAHGGKRKGAGRKPKATPGNREVEP